MDCDKSTVRVGGFVQRKVNQEIRMDQAAAAEPVLARTLTSHVWSHN